MNAALYVFVALILFYMICRLIYRSIHNKFIIVKTRGGLGNQMFQICLGYSISKRTNLKLLILISGEKVHGKDNHEYYNNIFKHFKDSIDYNSTNHNSFLDLFLGNIYYEPHNKFTSFDSDVLNFSNSIKFVGYFQNEKYFINHKNELIQIFKDNCVYRKVHEKHNKMESYFIHFRRGDYLKSGFHYVNLDIYYRNAIEYILDLDKNAHFYIISDDIEYCKTYNLIKDINKTFYENDDELETMYFMSLCNKGGICCNSTFSWFGSYLNTNSDKKVIFPDRWIRDVNFENDIYYENSIVLPTKKTPMTIVSGYWIVDNKHGDKYKKWFANTLSVNCPYVFFGDEQTIKIIKEYRKNFPTYYIKCDIEDFYTYKHLDNFIIDKDNCPSKELNCIWNEKIFLIQKAKNINPFNSKFFIWMDAGICTYREKKPPLKYFPNCHKLKDLPINKFIFTSSERKHFELKRVGSYNYHYVSGTLFCMSIGLIDEMCEVYKRYLDLYVKRKDNLYTDQVIYTLIYKDRPELFYKMGDGYGKLSELLN